MNDFTESFTPESVRPLAKIEYRSPGLEHGTLNRIGVSHIHIDGARDPAVVFGIVKELEAKGDLGKFNYVVQSTGGRQRAELPEVYESHTPIIEGQETLDFFSSNIVKNREDAIQAVNLIKSKIKDIPGAIVELEQVVGWYDNHGWKWIGHKDELDPIQATEVESAPQHTWPYEIHHGFNLPKNSETPPIELEKLMRDCEKAGIVMGGWFVFDKGEEWAFRSNAFSKDSDIRKVVEREQQALNIILDGYKQGGKTRTLVESVLGIWHSEG